MSCKNQSVFILFFFLVLAMPVYSSLEIKHDNSWTVTEYGGSEADMIVPYFQNSKDKSTDVCFKKKETYFLELPDQILVKEKDKGEKDNKYKAKAVYKDGKGEFCFKCKGNCKFGSATVEVEWHELKYYYMENENLNTTNTYYIYNNSEYDILLDGHWINPNGKHGLNTTGWIDEYTIGKIDVVSNYDIKRDGFTLFTKSYIDGREIELKTDYSDLYNVTINYPHNITFIDSESGENVSSYVFNNTATVYFYYINGTADPTTTTANITIVGLNGTTLSGSTITGTGNNFHYVEMVNKSEGAEFVNVSINATAGTIVSLITYNMSLKDIMLYYSFNDNSTRDHSGNQRHGTKESAVAGQPLYRPNGNGQDYGSMFSSNSDSDRIVYPSLGIFDGNYNYTMAIWFNKTSSTDNQGLWGSMAERSNRVEFRSAWGGADRPAWNQYDGSNHPLVITQSIELNRWYHLVITFNTDDGRVMYLDGVENISSSNVYYPNAGSDKNTFGSRREDDYHFDGMYDEAMIFNRTLSATEVAVLYNTQWKRLSINHSQIGVGYEQHTFNISANDTYFQAYTELSSDTIYGDLEYIQHNITESAPEPPAETNCTYQGSGDFTCDCGAYNIINVSANLPANDVLIVPTTGSGTIDLTANITAKAVYVDEDCKLFIKQNSFIDAIGGIT